MTIMTHDDYVAQIDYDPEIGMFHGRIVNIHSVVNFYGKSVDDLKKEFETSVKVYLDVCREKGIEPNKPYSGRVHVRMSPEQHKRFALVATAEGKSLNSWALEAMEHAYH